MTQLVNDPQVGGIFREYMPEGEVRTYIKDAVLNRHALIYVTNLSEDTQKQDVRIALCRHLL